MKTIKLPEGEVEFANPAEALWTRVKESTEARIKNTEDSLIVDRAFLKMCEQKLTEAGR